MIDAEIWAAIVAAVKEETGNDTLAIGREMTALDVPGWDSLAHVRILMNLEGRIGVAVDVDQTYRATCIGDLIEIVKAAAPPRR